MDKSTNELRVLKIIDGVHTLPRPSRKGNLANVVKHIPAIKATWAKKREEGASEYRRAYSARLDNRLPTPSGWWS